MSLMEELKQLGVDVDEGLERVMGDSSLYEMMLGMFIDSVNGSPIQMTDFDGSNLESLIQQVHMLKGVTGNLAMTTLFTQYTKVLELLRAGNAAQAKEGFAKLQPEQSAILECIQRHTAQ